MTVIAGYVVDDTVAIAADTQEQTRVIRFTGRSKLHQLGPCWVGSSGAGFCHDFLESVSSTNVPDELPHDPKVWRGVVCKLVADFHAWARERGHGAVEEASWYLDACFLVATPGGLFCVDCTGAVRQVRRYHALGSGLEVAVGALCVLDTYGPSGDDGRGRSANEQIVEAAVWAAIKHAPGCGGEVEVRTVTLQKADKG